MGERRAPALNPGGNPEVVDLNSAIASDKKKLKFADEAAPQEPNITPVVQEEAPVKSETMAMRKTPVENQMASAMPVDSMPLPMPSESAPLPEPSPAPMPEPSSAPAPQTNIGLNLPPVPAPDAAPQTPSDYPALSDTPSAPVALPQMKQEAARVVDEMEAERLLAIANQPESVPEKAPAPNAKKEKTSVAPEENSAPVTPEPIAAPTAQPMPLPVAAPEPMVAPTPTPLPTPVPAAAPMVLTPPQSFAMPPQTAPQMPVAVPVAPAMPAQSSEPVQVMGEYPATASSAPMRLTPPDANSAPLQIVPPSAPRQGGGYLPASRYESRRTSNR